MKMTNIRQNPFLDDDKAPVAPEFTQEPQRVLDETSDDKKQPKLENPHKKRVSVISL